MSSDSGKAFVPAWLRPSLVVALVGVLYLGVALSSHQWNPFSFVFIGDRYQSLTFTQDSYYVAEPGNPGYDGEYYYYLAVEPYLPYNSERRQLFIDSPGHRYNRILYPYLSGLLGGGQPPLIPWAMIFINLASIVLGTEIVSRILKKYGVSPWYSLVYGFYVGLWCALRRDLPDPLCFLFIAWGFWLYLEGKLNRSAILFTLALLTKEIAFFFVGPLLTYLFFQKYEWKTNWFLSLILIPYLAFELILALYLSKFTSLSLGELSFFGVFVARPPLYFILFVLLVYIITVGLMLGMASGLGRLLSERLYFYVNLFLAAVVLNNVIVLRYSGQISVVAYLIQIAVILVASFTLPPILRWLMDKGFWFSTLVFSAFGGLWVMFHFKPTGTFMTLPFAQFFNSGATRPDFVFMGVAIVFPTLLLVILASALILLWRRIDLPLLFVFFNGLLLMFSTSFGSVMDSARVSGGLVLSVLIYAAASRSRWFLRLLGIWPAFTLIYMVAAGLDLATR